MSVPRDPYKWTPEQFQAFKRELNEHDKRSAGRTLTLPDNVHDNIILDQALFVKGSDPQLFRKLTDRASVSRNKKE